MKDAIEERIGKRAAWIMVGADGRRHAAPLGGSLVCERSYHGQYDVYWIVMCNDEGHELARFNVLHLASIFWEASQR